MRPSSSIVVVTSCRCGTFEIVTGPSASSVDARIGSTAFFAPEIHTSPFSGSPPVIRIFANAVPLARRFVGRESLQLQRVDRAAHEVAERGVDHAMTGERQFAGKGRTDD